MASMDPLLGESSQAVSQEAMDLITYAEPEREVTLPITQENGQRIYRPSEGCDAVPPKGSEVFVGKLPRHLNETHLIPVFEGIGKIYQLRLMMDFSGTNRGYCFVKFYSTEDADRAIKQLNRFEITKGRRIGVTKSVENCRLFIGALPKDKTRAEILTEICQISENVVGVNFYPPSNPTINNPGFAFVEYENHKAAAMARRRMIPGRVQMWGAPITIDWADPPPEVDENIKTLLVRKLQLSTTEEIVHQFFNDVSGNRVERLRKLRDYAFVHFDSHEVAEFVKRTTMGAKIDGEEVEILWGKPKHQTNRSSRSASHRRRRGQPRKVENSDAQSWRESGDRQGSMQRSNHQQSQPSPQREIVQYPDPGNHNYPTLRQGLAQYNPPQRFNNFNQHLDGNTGQGSYSQNGLLPTPSNFDAYNHPILQQMQQFQHLGWEQWEGNYGMNQMYHHGTGAAQGSSMQYGQQYRAHQQNYQPRDYYQTRDYY